MKKEAGAKNILELLKGFVGQKPAAASEIVKNIAKEAPSVKGPSILSGAKKSLRKAPIISSLRKKLIDYNRTIPDRVHYSQSTGKAAKAARMAQLRKDPDAGSLLGLLLPKNIKRTVDKTITNIDEGLGELVTKPGQKKGMFIKKDYVPDPNNPGKYVLHHSPSIGEPVKKVSAFAAPMLSAMYVSEKLNKKKEDSEKTSGLTGGSQYTIEKKSMVAEDTMNNMVQIEKGKLEKTAQALKQYRSVVEKNSELEKTAEKKERVEKLAFKMVEVGKVAPYQSHDEFVEKCASLMNQDEKELEILDKALDLNVSDVSLGKPGKMGTSGTGNPFDQLVFE